MARYLLIFLLLLGCQTPPPPVAATRPAPANIRHLRTELPGRTMRQVITRLGPPGYVTTLSDREIWEYRDRATDPITTRPVSLLEIHFVHRRVERVEFFYGD